MDDYKIVFIYGKEKPELGIIEGKIDCIGKIKDGGLHSTYLLEFASKYYSEAPIFKRLNSRHIPEDISFFYCHYFDHIVFLNTTRFNHNGEVTQHGKSGRFLLPDNISLKQKESLYKFLEIIDDYSIIILSNLKLENGLLSGKELRSISSDTPASLFDKFFDKVNNTSKTI